MSPLGLTALDDPDSALGRRTNKSQLTAREEVINLLTALQLPLSENAKRHAAKLAQWILSRTNHCKVHEMVSTVPRLIMRRYAMS